MPDYKKMYFQLAGKVADAIDILIAAQRAGEKSFVEDYEKPEIHLLHRIKTLPIGESGDSPESGEEPAAVQKTPCAEQAASDV